MCVDANAGARAAARERAKQKAFAFKSEGVKFFNRETTLEKQQNLNVLGFSRDNADAYAKAIITQGKGRKNIENAYRKYFASQKVNEGGRSRKFGFAGYQSVLQAESEVQSVLDAIPRNMAYFRQGATRKFQSANASAKEALGLPPEYGMPVMMPPTNRLGGALQIAQAGLSIASSMSGLGAFGGGTGPLSFIMGSDRRLKENIKQVGTSPKGYNIYEFNYKGGKTRFRGAMAQDVVKKNPMAVGIDQNYLTVDYSKIDVNMEVV